MIPDTKGGFPRVQTFRVLRAGYRASRAGLIVAASLLVALAIAVTAFVWQAINRIDIDPKALGDAMRDAVIVTLREGSPEQKLETIASLEKIGADAAPFVPALIGTTNDEDPRVRKAANAALDRIAPDALDEDEEK